MSKELKTGIISLVIIALGIWGYNFLKGQNMFSPNTRYFKVEYSNVGGLSLTSSVTINGFAVGKVDNIKLNNSPNKKGELLVTFSVENDFDFSKNSIVKIYSPNPLAGANLAIIPKYDGELAVSGDTLQGQIEESLFSSIGERLNPIQNRLDQVLGNADSLIVGLNNVLDKKAQMSLRNSLISLEGTAYGLRKTITSVNSLIDSSKTNLTATLSNAKTITDNFSKVSEDISKTNFGASVKKLEGAVDNVNALIADIKNGKGTLGKLVTDEKMYTNLTNASKELEELLREMKLNPKRFVHFSLFGKKPKPYNEENNHNNISNSKVKDK